MDRVQQALKKQFQKKCRITAKQIQFFDKFHCLTILIGSEHRSSQNVQKQFQRWFFGVEILDSIIIITPNRLIILSNQIMLDKLNYIQGVNLKQFSIQLMTLDNNKLDKQFENILQILRAENSASTYKIGINLQDGFLNSYLVAHFITVLNVNKIQKIDGTLFINQLITKENEQILKNNLYCRTINKYYMNLIFQKILQSIRDDDKKTNFQISQAIKIEKNQGEHYQTLDQTFKLISTYEILNVVLQSGENYKVDAEESSNEKLVEDVIIISFGCEYEKSQVYCSRTLILKPAVQLEQVYNTILNVQNFTISQVKEQIQFKQIYQQSKYLWNQIYKDDILFQNKFPSDLGYVLNSYLIIDENNTELIQNKMVVVIRINISNINVLFPRQSEQHTVSICLADSVYVSNETDDCVITKLKKDFLSIACCRDRKDGRFRNPIPQKAENIDTNKLVENELIRINSDQQKLKEINQQKLEVILNENLMQQESEYQFKQTNQKLNKVRKNFKNFLQVRQLQTNKTLIYQFNLKIQISAFMLIQFKIYLQNKFLTIKQQFKLYFGQMNLTQQRNEIFIRQIILENFNIIKLKEIENEITVCKKKEMEKQIKKNEQIENFALVSYNIPNLTHLHVRSNQNFQLQSLTGALVCHQNGFSYQYSKCKVINLEFSNIKYIYFVSPFEEIMACFHFELKKPIGSEKQFYKSIQFYREIEGAILQKKEIEIKICDKDNIYNQRILNRRKEQFDNFSNFIQQSEQYFRSFNLRFEILDKQLSFEGNYYIDRHCLVNIVDLPNIVLHLDNVELVCFERAQAVTISFDFIAVLKDLEAPVIRIDAVDKVHLTMLQGWLNDKKILFFSTSKPIIWRNVLFSILKNFSFFVNNGGWDKIMKDYMDQTNQQQQDSDNYLAQKRVKKIKAIFTPSKIENMVLLITKKL